jgi:putative methionine-R-sulfoxide reductase with GAF domain
MAVLNPVALSGPSNRRRRVRHKIQTPAYATFTGESRTAMLDLHEILNISEEGVAIQCQAPLEIGRRVNLCLDLAECAEHIYTAGQVVWSNASGRSGLRFAELPPLSLFRLREWLFLNAVAAVANADESAVAIAISKEHVAPRPSYTDTLAAVTAVQREVEALGRDLAAALQLIAARAQTLIRASGAAIALVDRNPEFMVCRASSGQDAPPVGTKLQVGSGFSGECVKTGLLLRCHDTENDARVDRESCRALGIRSVIAVPVRVGEKSIAILEAFSAQPRAFSDTDGTVVQRLAETILAAINRAARAENLPPLESPPTPVPFAPTPGSVLFASQPGEEKKDESKPGGSAEITLPLGHLILLVMAACVIFLALGYQTAPLIQSKLQERGRTHLQTVLASSQPPKQGNGSADGPSVEIATLEQLRQMAEKGDPAAQNVLGLRYATGDGLTVNERQAVYWFTRAAEQGNVAAQSKLGSVYFRGRDIPQNFNQAFFWMILARANGDENSKILAPLVAGHLTREQINSIQMDANRWLQQHRESAKPSAAR